MASWSEVKWRWTRRASTDRRADRNRGPQNGTKKRTNMWTQRFGYGQCVSKALGPTFDLIIGPEWWTRKPCLPVAPGNATLLVAAGCRFLSLGGSLVPKKQPHTQHAPFHDMTPVIQGHRMNSLLRSQLPDPFLKLDRNNGSTNMRLYLISQVRFLH